MSGYAKTKGMLHVATRWYIILYVTQQITEPKQENNEDLKGARCINISSSYKSVSVFYVLAGLGLEGNDTIISRCKIFNFPS